MAFGRSNSLSINTGQANSLFGSTPATSQAAPAAAQTTSSLFGNTNNTTTSAGGLFGNTSNTAQTQNRGLFGSTNTAAANPFGNPGATAANTTNTGGTSLFGNMNQPQQQQPQQQQSGSSLFANLNNNTQAAGSSLFGNNSAQQQQQQQQQQPSLFGSTSANITGPSLFGAQQPQQQPQQQPTNTIFGLSASQPPSLLNASQYRNSQYAPFAGKLSMGQQVQAPATQGAVKINFDAMRPTTRFGDCIEDIQKQLEAIDSMIQAQERFCREIEAFLPKHGSDVKSIAPDVALIHEKADAVEYALSTDAQTVAARRPTLEVDIKDFQRCQRVVENLRMPAQFHMPSVGYSTMTRASPAATGGATKPATTDDPTYDMDLIGNFFTPRAAELQGTLASYASNLSEIEAHLRVIESSAVGQAQQLAARRAGIGNGGSSAASVDDTVRDLAETLRAFEGSILGAASLVGECREGVNGLVLGRLAGAGR